MLSITGTYGMCVNIFTAEGNLNSDVVVRVQNKRFHVDKQVSWNDAKFRVKYVSLVFSVQSTYLSVILMLSDKNVEEIARLANLFGVGWLLVEGKFFLSMAINYSFPEKLLLAHRFRMDRLKVRLEQELGP